MFSKFYSGKKFSYKANRTHNRIPTSKRSPLSSNKFRGALTAAIAFTIFAYSYNKFKTQSNKDNKLKEQQHNELEASLLYLMAYGQIEDIQDLANQSGKIELKKILTTTKTCRNNNALHLATKHNSKEVILKLIDILENDASNLAIQTNHEGTIPFGYINSNTSINNSNLHPVASTFMFITKSPPTTELSNFIDEKKLLSERYPDINDKYLLFNLTTVVQVVNEARNLIKKSSSHHAINAPYSASKKAELPELSSAIISLRLKTQISSFFSFFSSEEEPERIARYAIKNKVGNCLELAHIVYVALKNKNLKSSVEIFVIANGDHAFNVFGRIPDSDPNNPATWGDNTIIADAWAGDVYLASEINEKLKNYQSIAYKNERQYFLTPYNPRYHKLKVINTHHPPDASMEGVAEGQKKYCVVTSK